MHHSRVLIPYGAWLPLSIVAAMALSLFAGWATLRPEPAFDARCESLDSAASQAVSDLIGERSVDIEQRLGDAMFRLRRARTYCRHGLVGLARLDYQALTDGRYSNYRRLGDYQVLSQQ